MKRILATLALVALTACAGIGVPAPKTPAQIVLETKAIYTGALVIAVQYKQLPSCAIPMHPVLCSDGAIVTKLQKADDIAKPLIDTAQKAVDDPRLGKSAVDNAIVAAQSALGALTAITSTLRTK